MKTFLGAKNKPVDRKMAMGVAAINLLATPGLGTIMAGRIFAGLLQLAFAGAGFLLIIMWFVALFRSLAGTGAAGPAWYWQLGLSSFLVGWLGSLWTSLDLIRKTSAATPPKLDGTRG